MGPPDQQPPKREERIKSSFVIRFKKIEWPYVYTDIDVSKVKDVSKTGICFDSPEQYMPGEKLEVTISHPLLTRPCEYLVRVVRILPSPRDKFAYETAVEVAEIKEEDRRIFSHAIDLFLDNQKNKQ